MTAILRLQPLRVVALAIVAALAVLAVTRLASPPRIERPAEARVRLLTSAPADFASALARVDERVAAAEQDARQRAGEWLFHERLAAAYVARGRLTGSLDDYARAQTALDRAFALAPRGAGPHLSQAELHYHLHRLAKAEQMLAMIDGYAMPPNAGERAEIEAIRGDIAFYRGRTAEAQTRYANAARIADSPAIAFRMAVLARRTGELDRADSGLARVLAMQRFVTPQALAEIELQRGALALGRGRFAEAKAHIAKARAAFPGYWLADAYAAQMLAIEGDLMRSAALFEDVARRTGDPVAMDALASVQDALGNREAANLWASRAGAAWEARVQRLPEAGWSHAADHHVAFGDPARALDLARMDAAARPYGDAKVVLASALLANRRPREVLDALGEARATGWVSAEVHLLAAEAHAQLGNDAEAAAERTRALALNPRAFDKKPTPIWFH